ncbi:IKI3 family-domain-containing protein [Microdochium trichocladiopsis]|uniref:Elongator complex protein 1 n=1 Tax=Microdochium trichocladiopsis TaxID=1682393 RepID=A0A9P9BVN6_9PEZI|nr:IKI3 family-domain-containing protein [Microdochium trichocladiopsis]KAH7040468.1 IKI3 family-domain-containing protein [Microdochium trichocladiopsis]
MRNLRNIRHHTWTTPSAEPVSVPISATCWDPAQDQVLCTFGPREHDGQIQLVRVVEHVRPSSVDVEHVEVASWPAPSPNPDLLVDRVVSLHHFADNGSTCLVFEGGDIVVVQESDPGSSDVHIEIMGSIDEGITAARWSPDEELLAITTKANTLVFMSRNFEGVTDATMGPDDLKLSKHVNVGWGKKETQFQGKGAKAMRDPTIPEKVDEGKISPTDDGSTTISWRGDGAYVAVNSIETGVRRVIRVFSRDGVLDSVSEPVDHLEAALSWRPSGNLIAGIQRIGDRTDVVFFERNGLRHGQFSLRDPKDRSLAQDRIRLEWNSDSTVLGVVLHDRTQFWTTGNYHWYLKAEAIEESRAHHLTWHPEKALRFASATSDKLVLGEYILDIARGSLAAPYDYGAVAVIDGNVLKLTPFRTANVPPPMALFELPAPSSILDVSFSPANTYMGLLHTEGFSLYEWKLNGERSLKPVLIGSLDFPKTAGGRTTPLQIFVSETGNVYCLCHNKNSLLRRYVFDSTVGDFTTEDGMYATSLSGFAGITQASTRAVLAFDCLGKLHNVADQEDEIFSVRLPSQLPWTQVVDLAGQVIAFGLSRNGHLYANSRLLLKNCTSFLITTAHVVVTTSNHLVKFIHLTDVESMEVPPDDPETDERCRSIERGARLVTAMPTNMSLVLQMPRGNLETIYPRAMVLAGIRHLIEQQDYAGAFTCCRTQRVDMNILFDHRPQQFLENTGLFIEQLADITYIDLFLSSLRNEDVTQSMYRDTKPGASTSASAEPSTASADAESRKVNRICNAVLSYLNSRKTLDNGTLQNIITANVCKDPPAYESGLLVVAKLMQEDEKLAEKAVEHICFLADVNTLYDEALGLYDLELATLVAQQSQRDPREYLPFIQDLHKLPEIRRQFAIDDHLKRKEKALAHLQELQAHAEAQDYTVKHTLYGPALKLYRYDPANLTTLTGLYATYLESMSRFREAGLTYESLQDFAAATRCYRAAGSTCWRECLFTASLQEPALSAEAHADLAMALADALYEAKDYVSAATVHIEHLKSLDTAIPYLCKGYLFADAQRLCVLHNRPELLESAVDTGLAEALSSSTEFFADCKAQLKAQLPRILELRQKAAEDPLAFYEGERAGGIDLPDDVSVAASSRVSTSASLFTRYTGKNGSVGTAGTGVSRATSKNRKREEKKRARGRKGTVYEEEYLVNSVRRLVERVEGNKAETERLVFGLVRRGMMERARTVEALMAEVVEACSVAIREVFPAAAAAAAVAGGGVGGVGEGAGHPDGGGGGGAVTDEASWEPSGADAVLAATLEAKWRTQEPPVITGVQKLSILGS